MPARILPPMGMRAGACPSRVGGAGCAPLIVTTALLMLRSCGDARELASLGSRTKTRLQVLAPFDYSCSRTAPMESRAQLKATVRRAPKDRGAETIRANKKACLRLKWHGIRQRWHWLVRAPHPCGNALTVERPLLACTIVRIHERAHHMKRGRLRARIKQECVRK